MINLLFYGEHFYGFSENDSWKHEFKRNIHCTTNISIYTGHRHFEVLWRFILYIFLTVCFVFKNSHLAYIPPYMHKTLPTLGNEKEQ